MQELLTRSTPSTVRATMPAKGSYGMVSYLILATMCFAAASASPRGRRADMTLHEYITSVPAGFVDSGPAKPDTILDLRIALVQNNQDGLIEAFHNVSTPGHPSFGQYLSLEEVAEFTAPAPDTVSAVNIWLEAAGLSASPTTFAGDWLRLNTTVSTANKLLDTTFSIFTDTKTGQQSIRTLNYSIPSDLVGHIEFVHPTIFFSSTGSAKSNSTIVARAPNRNGFPWNGCNEDLVTPTCVQRLHGVPATVPHPAGSIGVSGIGDQYANDEDLESFMRYYRPDIPRPDVFLEVSVNGGKNDQDITQAGEEADLDMQYTMGIAVGVPTTFYSIGRANPDVVAFEALLNYFQQNPNKNLPSVLLTAYSARESQFPTALSRRICTGYADLGARGVSVIFSTGDGGVAGPELPGVERCPEGKFVPVFPASCPYVTSVGATAIQSVPEHVGTFIQDAAAISGGGFSNQFTNSAEFSWQSSAVDSYLRNLPRLHPTYAGKYNPFGRAYPDVSTVGSEIAMDYRGRAQTADGTSASAAIFASIIAMINAERLAQNKPTLGFLNRFLYANPNAFQDITRGSNPGCNTAGFSATTGWDPVTGLGTPIYNRLSAAGLAWPAPLHNA
ncbi:hypothetical protein NM688_g5504 [Phlebia brevispora]|uniref:Uncharacterized protein n=1 Tax=Phlebia brevispora TaxID=194682 RepID=A0ACC1SUM0_9APHY|nr:hypothetical protein NM688_g5504 [Phlebia brevispora]